MAIGMYEYQVRQVVILGIAISVMEFELLLALNSLSTAGTASLLVTQHLAAKR